MSFLGIFPDRAADQKERELQSQIDSYRMAEDAFAGMSEDLRRQLIEAEILKLKTAPQLVGDIGNLASRHADEIARTSI